MIKPLAILGCLIVTAMLFLLLAPRLILSTLPACASRTTFVSHNENGYVISQGEWQVRPAGDHALGQFSGGISYYSPTYALQRTYSTHFSYDQEMSLSGNFLKFSTKNLHLIFGNEAKPDMIYQYIAPELRVGTVFHLRVVKVNNLFYSTAHIQLEPRGVCTRKL